MIIWIDAQISPSIAAWINRSYANIQAKSVRSLDLQRADDHAIFDAAKH
jgi:predicted nuclease of predicted toxin-antitoxin system